MWQVGSATLFGYIEGSSKTTRPRSTLGNRSTARVESDQPAA